VVVGGTFLFDFDSVRMLRCLKLPSHAFRTRLHRLLDRRLTTFRKELGGFPPRDSVKVGFVGNLACCFDAEPRHARVCRTAEPAIGIAAARLAQVLSLPAR
jgi:hypothetical protein